MKETFPDRLVDLQQDPDYFTLEKLDQLKVIFGRVCDELNLTDFYNDPHQRDKLAIIILVRAKAYHFRERNGRSGNCCDAGAHGP